MASTMLIGLLEEKDNPARPLSEQVDVYRRAGDFDKAVQCAREGYQLALEPGIPMVSGASKSASGVSLFRSSVPKRALVPQIIAKPRGKVFPPCGRPAR